MLFQALYQMLLKVVEVVVVGVVVGGEVWNLHFFETFIAMRHYVHTSYEAMHLCRLHKLYRPSTAQITSVIRYSASAQSF